MRRRALGAALLVAGLVGGPATPASADTVRETQWHLRYLNVAEAHKHSQGDGIVVAVLDSGVDATHPDLSGNVLAAVSAIGSDDTAQSDPDGRGTALAGLIAAHGHGTDGGDGVLGLAPKAKILPVVIATQGATSGKGPTGDPDAMAKGIELALQRGAKVICVGRSAPSSQPLLEAIADALRANVILVAADGDRAGEDFPTYPAAFPGVVAAAPMNRDLSVTVASGSGRALALAAPGAEITSTATRGGYRIDAGGAAGIVAGAVALVRSKYPLLPSEEVVHRLTATAADAGPPGPDDLYGNGRLNVVAALTAPVPLLHPGPSAAASVSPTPSGAGSPGAAAGRSGGRPMGWLVLFPLLVVFGVLGWYAFRTERRIPARPRPGSAGSAPDRPDSASTGSFAADPVPSAAGSADDDEPPGSGDCAAPDSGTARLSD